MKVLIATPMFPPDVGGPATDTAMLKRELPKHGIDVTVCTFGSVRHMPRGIRHVKYAWELLARARSARAIVAMDTFSVCLPAMLVAKILHKPFIVRVPGDFAWEQATQRFGAIETIEGFQTKRYGWRVELIRSLEWFAVRQADLVMVISDFLEGIVSQWGVKPERLTRIYLGLESDELVTMPREIPAERIIFSLGRFVPWKGFAMLIDLMSELPDEWHLVLVGDGPLRAPLARRTHELGITGRVTFAGILPRAEVLGWYRRADVFVLNTAQENFSFQVLEAMMARARIITTAIGSLPELITNGVEGVLCAPNDKGAFKQAILSIERQPKEWERRAERAKAKSRLFSAEASTSAFADALKSVIMKA